MRFWLRCDVGEQTCCSVVVFYQQNLHSHRGNLIPLTLVLSYIIFVGSLAMQIDDEPHLRSSTRSTMSHNNARKYQVDARGS